MKQYDLLDSLQFLFLTMVIWLSAHHSTFAIDSGVVIEQVAGHTRISWPLSSAERGSMVFNSNLDQPLIESIGIGDKPMVTGLNPVTLITVGSRDMTKPAGWVAFFDNPRSRPYTTSAVVLGSRRLKITSEGARTTVSVAEASAGSFQGDVRFTFYRNSRLIYAETVLSTQEDGRAFYYDTGLASAKPDWHSTVWRNTDGKLQRATLDATADATSLKVAGRAIVAESETGSLAVFPAPHRFFFPLDEAFNLRFVWHGRNYDKKLSDYGIGIRQEGEGDKRFVPWFNAPPSTEQHLGVFYLVTSGNGERALDDVAKYTHGDRYPKLPGYSTFTSHYHIEHTKEYMGKQKEQNITGVPQDLEVPGFVKTFKARGVNIVHLAEFHNGKTLTLQSELRLPELKCMHDECARLSDEHLLVLPGEEANVHLGGHWLSFFPKPVYWVLNNRGDKPFAEQVDGYGRVYHVRSEDDVLHLMQEESGLMWTAHARIKSSIGFPDAYKDKRPFRSDNFLGAAWKAMPADLSRPTLGWRVLDLMDDMANWGLKKQVIGEADLFRMEPDFETYAHMNINYLKLDKLPKFQDGWQPVLDALRGGQFFTTTGEIVIPEFTIGGKSSGQTLDTTDIPSPMLEVVLDWTFPLEFAEVVSGDGKKVYRQRIDLVETESFGRQTLHRSVDLKGRTWARFEVWDVAANGAFTQPIWLTRTVDEVP